MSRGLRRTRAALFAGLVAAITVLGVVTLANAGEAVIHFDDLAAGTTVRDQYADQGVTFGSAGVPDGLSVVATDNARSAPNAALLESCARNCANRAVARLGDPATAVRLYVGSVDATNLERGVVLLAYDASGNELGTARTSVNPGDPVAHELHVEVPGEPAIASFVVDVGGTDTDPAGIAIDDVTITRPDAPPDATAPPPTTETSPPSHVRSPPPAFDLRLSSNGDTVDVATVPQGATRKARLQIVRENGSTGPVQLELNGGAERAQFELQPVAEDRYDLHITGRTGKDAVGDSIVTITGSPSATAGAAPRTLEFTLRVVRRHDLRVIGMEVSQGTQGPDPELPAPGPGPKSENDPVPYAGVPFSQGPRTIVRVFSNRGFYGEPVNKVPAVLHGTVNGKALPGSPIAAKPITLKTGPHTAGREQRTSGANVHTFTLPPEWTKPGTNLTLKAKLLPPSGSITSGTSAECESAGCAANNDFAVRNIPIRALPRITILPVALTKGGKKPPNLDEVFPLARVLTPLGGSNYDLRPYAAQLDMTGTSSTRDAYGSRVRKWAADNKHLLSPRTLVLGVHGNTDVGGASWADLAQAAEALKPGSNTAYPVAIVCCRQITNVAHEIGHQLGRPHASTACGGGDDGQVGEPWPPDERGRLQGIGIDRRQGSGPFGGYELIFNGSSTFAHDYMSYCAVNARPWISPINWTRMFDYLRALGSKHGFSRAAPPEAADAVGGGSAIEVHGYASDAGAVIDTVDPAAVPAGARARQSDAGGITLVARDAAGQIVGSAPASVVAAQHHHGPSAHLSIFGRVPAPGARSVELTGSAGEIMARREASPNAPRVSIQRMRTGTRLRGRGLVRVTARVQDPDGGGQRLELRYSLDGGRTYTTLRTREGAAGTVRFSVRGRELPATRKGRLSVVANDGFNEGVDTSRRLVFEGVAPVVTVESPRARTRLRADERIELRGHASDDRGRTLPDRSLTWYVGRRRVGRGAELSLPGLRAGRHVVRLEARDRLGRRGRRSVTVRVDSVSPQFLVLSGRRTGSRRARRIAIRVASTIPADLVVGRRRFEVGRRTRRISVRAPRRGALELVLRSGRQRTRATLDVR